jgi:hypothetical protein
MPTLPNDGAEPPFKTWFPPDGGYRFELITLPPDGIPAPADVDKPQALAETKKLLPGLTDVMDPKHPGWHSTDTIDLLYVVSGECILKLDSGETTTLRREICSSRPARATLGPIRATLRARCSSCRLKRKG